jgi:hypothetical protein
MNNKLISPGLVAMNQRTCCEFCGKSTTKGNIARHKIACYLNPLVKIDCKVCGSPIKDYKHSKGTCSYACSNKFFRSGYDNGNWKGENYRNIAKIHHEMCCVICNEDKIVAVHHYDGNHDNHVPENLIPLCPTHHQYVHSRYKSLVIEKIDKYRDRLRMA